MAVSRLAGVLGCWAAIFAACYGAASSAVEIRVDYSYDGSGFFNTSTIRGQQARAALGAAADFYSDVLTDSLAPVNVPSTYFGSSGGIASFFLSFANPTDPSNLAGYINLASYSIPQNEIVIFVGGAALGGGQLASAGIGTSNLEYSVVPSEVATVEAIYQGFVDSYETRGQSSGFADWGGTISFDNDGSTNWSYNPNAQPSGSQYDLYSVALHEIGHVLGFSRPVFEDLGLLGGAGANAFVGAEAAGLNGGAVPLQPGGGHWAEGTSSRSVVTGSPQETLFDPTFNNGARKELTLLDAAALSDLGWSVALPTQLPGDYNGDHRVDAADYTVWRDNLGSTYQTSDYSVWRQNFGRTAASVAAASSGVGAPEPGAGMLLLIAGVLLAPRARRAA